MKFQIGPIIFLAITSTVLAQHEVEGPPDPGRTRVTSTSDWRLRSSLPPPPMVHYHLNGSAIDTRFLHLQDHPSLVTEKYGREYTSAVWRCDFRYNYCFLKNRVKWAPFKVTSHFAGIAQSLVLDVGQAVRSLHEFTGRPRPIYGYNGARLTSNGYFPARYADACLTFSYYWNGAGRKTLKMLQINEETSCIYADEIGSSDLSVQTQGQWKDIQLQLDLRYGHAKFVIEVQFDSPDQKTIDQLAARQIRFDHSLLGHVAIRDFSIGYGRCQRNDGPDECDVPPVNNYLTDDRYPAPRPPIPDSGNYAGNGNGNDFYIRRNERTRGSSERNRPNDRNYYPAAE